uniref:C-type mannose receptor 2-like n=2 Tax=Gouania willdenowi TaxID=441366 RepID=A0A8C5D0T4_GOUWI
MLVLKSSPPRLFLLIIIISTSSMFGLGSVVRKTYQHVVLHYTWKEAWHNCKSSNSDLAIVQTEEDKGMINFAEYYSWIGLTKGIDSYIWHWDSSAKLEYFPWAKSEPETTDSCAYIHYSSNKFYGSSCEDYLFFFCEDGTNFKFFNETKTQTEAQEYCKQHDMELAKFVQRTSVGHYEFSLWIGTVNGFEPEQSDECVTITSQSKTMAAHNCSDRFPSVCMTDNVILVKEKKSWEEAMTYCRELVLSAENQSRYELVSVEDGKDDKFLRARASQADTEQVWVGLRFLGGTWFWINGVSMGYPNLPQCPLPRKNCGVISKTAARLETTNCGEKKNFLCYKLED